MNLASMSDEALAQLFQNCLRQVLKNSPMAPAAEQRLCEVKNEWRRRVESVRLGQVFVEMPERGMLATLGYRVGNSGERPAARRALLDYAMCTDLPFVASIGYTLEWGEPRSRKRLNKMLRTLEGLAAGAENRETMGLACTHWIEDRDYIEHRWQNQVT